MLRPPLTCLALNSLQTNPFVWNRNSPLTAHSATTESKWPMDQSHCLLLAQKLNGQGSSLFWQDRWFVQTSQVTSQSRSSIEQDTIKQGGHLWIRSRNLNQFFSKLLFFSLTFFNYVFFLNIISIVLFSKLIFSSLHIKY